MGKLERLAGPLCGLAILLCVLAAHPFSEAGIWDDWSYVLTVRHFAETGHIVYNGWSTAMLGVQLYLGAVFARLFGPSYTSVRASTMLLATLSGPLMYATLRRCGIRPRNAVLGVLACSLNPVYLELSALYMSDVPAFFALLLFFYLAVRALRAATSTATLAWLIAAIVVGAAAGTIRQIGWLSLFLAVPSLLWRLRRQTRVFMWGGVTWLGSLAVVVLCMRWFSHQPFVAAEKLMPVPLRIAQVHRVILPAIRNSIILSAVLLVPVTLGIALRMPGSYAVARKRTLVLLASTAAFVAAYVALYGASSWGSLIPGVMIRVSWFWEGFNYGQTPWYFTGTEQTLIAFAVVGCSTACCWTLFLRRRAALPEESRIATHHELLWLFLPFIAGYLALIYTRVYVFDRYLLIVLFFAVLGLLSLYQRGSDRPVSMLAYIPVLLIAVAGVGQTHDIFAEANAKTSLIREMVAAGVPRTDIYTGFATDGPVQIEHTGYVNEPRLLPKSLYKKAPAPSAKPCQYWYATYLPSMQGRYVFSNQPNLCYPTSTFAPVVYESWFRPRHRTIYAIDVPEGKRQHFDTP